MQHKTWNPKINNLFINNNSNPNMENNHNNTAPNEQQPSNVTQAYSGSTTPGIYKNWYAQNLDSAHKTPKKSQWENINQTLQQTYNTNNNQNPDNNYNNPSNPYNTQPPQSGCSACGRKSFFKTN
jgi:hypothetical protein